MPESSNTRQNVLMFVALLFLQLLLMSASVKGSDGAVLLESWYMRLSSPVVSLASAIGDGISGLVSGTGELFGARSRNAELERQLAEMREELSRSREAVFENSRLKQMLNMREALNVKSIGASVVARSFTDEVALIVVSRGADDGVEQDMPVVAHDCAVGRVVGVAPGHAKIRLLIDPNSGVGAVVQRRSRPKGIVFGNMKQGLDLEYVPGYFEVDVGDLVVTSGADGVFPRGFGLGNIEEIKTDTNGNRTMRLIPSLRYKSLEEVLILLEHQSGGLVPPWPDEGEPQ
jgi:rod shape-determining protein MreC